MTPQETINELIELIRNQRAVFIKTDNYVPAHITASNKIIGEDWSEDRLQDYLYGEAMLNKDKDASIFIGEAKYHSWVRHYRVTKVEGDKDWNWTYNWERIV